MILFQKKTGVTDKGDVLTGVTDHRTGQDQRFIGKINYFFEGIRQKRQMFFLSKGLSIHHIRTFNPRDALQ